VSEGRAIHVLFAMLMVALIILDGNWQICLHQTMLVKTKTTVREAVHAF
jgi:hypothetical protein